MAWRPAQLLTGAGTGGAVAEEFMGGWAVGLWGRGPGGRMMGHDRRVGKTITSPDGRQWRVRRRWLPRLGAESLIGRYRQLFRRRARKGADLGADGLAGGCVPIDGEGAVIGILVLVAVVVFVVVGLPVLLALVETIVLVVGAVAGIVGRVLFRRPWVVEAASNDGRHHHWRVVGWRRSGQHRDHVAVLLAAGADLPPADRPPADGSPPNAVTPAP